MPTTNEMCPGCQKQQRGHHLVGGPFSGCWQCNSCGYVDKTGETNSVHVWPGTNSIAQADSAHEEDWDSGPAEELVDPDDASERLEEVEKQLAEQYRCTKAAEQKAEVIKSWMIIAGVILALFLYASCQARNSSSGSDDPYCQSMGRTTECW